MTNNYSAFDLRGILYVLFLTCVYCVWKYRLAQSFLPLPPSPRGWPFIGHVLQVGSTDQWKTYHQWCKDLGTRILYLNMLGQNVIVLDAYEDCVELLEKRSSKYSGRARLVMVNELMGWDFNFGWMDYGNTWRDRRRLMHDSFNSTASKSFRPLQLKAARKLLPKLLNTDNVLPELRQLAGETIMGMAYGLDVMPTNDPYIEAAEQSVTAVFEAAVPGAFLVEMLPMLKYVPEWIPGATFKRKAREWRAITEKMVGEPFKEFLRQVNDGIARPSFSYDALQKVATRGGIYTEENIKLVAGTMYQAGSDTTMSALGFCILSLLDHPEMLRRIQDEIDNATDCARLPDFDDEDSLPYLMAFIKETMRYWSLGPLAVPHLLSEEDEYKGYRIPAGSMIVPNVWAMLHNDEIFDDPFTLNPDRFLFGTNLKAINAYGDIIWGFGRRVCIGRYVAFASTWITLAHIVAVFDISKAKDAHGNTIEPSHKPKQALLLCPPDYECRFTLRSDASQELLTLAGKAMW